MVLKTVLTIIVGFIVSMMWLVYSQIHPLIAGQIAPMQVQDSNVAYLANRFIAEGYNFLQWTTFGAVLLLIAIWWRPIVQLFKKVSTRSFVVFLVLLLAMTSMTGCRRPYKTMILVDVEPNQTAFVVPLVGQTSTQQQFASVEYLQDRQVATKRIEIEPVWHQTGHLNWIGEWIPSARVITVDRSPVTREWTQKAEKGTSAVDDAFEMESKESIDFSYGGTLSALIREENAAQFLYYFAGKSLATIIDTDIRAFMQGRLAEDFGILTLTEAQEQKGQLFADVCVETEEKFSDWGITITSCGASGGLIYHDSKIQTAITNNFEAQQEQIRATAALEAQHIENQRILAAAEAEAEAVRIAGQAQADVVKMMGEQVEDNPLVVNYEIARHSKGDVPQTFFYSGGDSSNLPFPFFLVDPDQTAK